MKSSLLLTVALLTVATPAPAVDWATVTSNDAGDRFFIDKSSIQRNDSTLRYWEYREFLQPNNAFLEEPVDQPVYGVVLSWSANCDTKTQKLRQVTAYDKNRKLIRRFVYGENASGIQPRSGSSSGAVLNYVCTLK